MLRKRGRNVSRLEAFSDAVFAISATLLVVSLEVPATFPELVSELRGFIPFGISFGALVLIWAVHNGFYRRYGLVDGMTFAINSILLFVVLFFVFPLKYMASGLVGFFSDQRLSGVAIESADQLAQLFMIYSSGFVAVFACVSLLYLHAWRSADKLELSPLERHEAAFLFRHYLLFVFTGLLSVLAARFGVGIVFGFPGFLYVLLGPLCWIHGLLSDRMKPAVQPG